MCLCVARGGERERERATGAREVQPSLSLLFGAVLSLNKKKSAAFLFPPAGRANTGRARAAGASRAGPGRAPQTAGMGTSSLLGRPRTAVPAPWPPSPAPHTASLGRSEHRGGSAWGRRIDMCRRKHPTLPPPAWLTFKLGESHSLLPLSAHTPARHDGCARAVSPGVSGGGGGVGGGGGAAATC